MHVDVPDMKYFKCGNNVADSYCQQVPPLIPSLYEDLAEADFLDWHWYFWNENSGNWYPPHCAILMPGQHLHLDKTHKLYWKITV